MAENYTYTALAMDRSEPVGNSIDIFSRRALHVKIGNTAAEPVYITATDPIPITTVPGAYNQVSMYAEVLAVPSSMLTTIQTYIVPMGQTFYFERCNVSGENIARYTLKVGATTIDSAYTWFAEGLSYTFNFASQMTTGYPITGGSTFSISVLHLRPMVGDFNARIQGVLS